MRAILLAILVIALSAPSAHTGHTLFRLTDLDLRDPHIHSLIPVFGCWDVTDTAPLGAPSYNQEVQTAMSSDADGDGFLDLSILLAFDPLDQSAPTGEVTIQRGLCTAPAAGTSCMGDPDQPPGPPMSLTNSSSGTCLAPDPGRLYGPYSPEVVPSTAPCFASSPSSWIMEIAGARAPLESAQIAARYVGNPADSLADGFIVGFLRKSVADTIITGNGTTLGSHLPGGTDCCRSGSGVIDVGPDGAPGWWMHWNFAARKVISPQETAVAPQDMAQGSGMEEVNLLMASPNPFRGETHVSFRLRASGRTTLRIHDAAGRLVSEPVDAALGAGSYSAAWSALDSHGAPLAAGVYFLRLETAAEARTVKVLLVP